MIRLLDIIGRLLDQLKCNVYVSPRTLRRILFCTQDNIHILCYLEEIVHSQIPTFIWCAKLFHLITLLVKIITIITTIIKLCINKMSTFLKKTLQPTLVKYGLDPIFYSTLHYCKHTKGEFYTNHIKMKNPQVPLKIFRPQFATLWLNASCETLDVLKGQSVTSLKVSQSRPLTCTFLTMFTITISERCWY